MSSFAIEHCRRVREGYAEFDVRILSGQLAVGDRFDCLDGMGQQVRFQVRKVKETKNVTLIECDGPITFDDQFARFTILTTPYPPKRPDLPMPGHSPKPTEEEIACMKICVPDWDYYHPLQQAAVLSVSRGLKTYALIAEELSVSPADIESAFRNMSNCVVRDSSTGEIHIR